MSFKKDFYWGVATAAYQIEGAAYENGKGLNIWDVFSKQGNNTFQNHHGDVACDHYHLFKEDIKIIKQMGVKHYRFSINWTRLIPNGIGELNPDGIRFYNELIDTLLEEGIEPWITLFHWDYPYELYKKGGWSNPDSPKWFEYYAKVVAELFSDRVKKFFTINEPQCFIGLGYYEGVHAPFLKLPIRDVIQMVHHVLIANGLATRALRKSAKQAIEVTMAMTASGKVPLKSEDYEVAKKSFFSNEGTLFSIRLWSDPVFLGKYPMDLIEWFGIKDFNPTQEEMDIIQVDMEYFSLNIYTGNHTTKDENGHPLYVAHHPNTPRTAMNWEVLPEILYYVPKFLYERYQKPIIISENGAAISEWKGLDGTINDSTRIDYIARHLEQLKKAAHEIPVAGYFYWSLMDNFEWAEGYSKRFGLIHIDYETQARTLKQSAYWYRDYVLKHSF